MPPLLLTSEPNSFAQRTMQQRIPRIVDEIIASNDYPAEIVARLRALRDEITDGAIQLLREDAPDIEFWNASAREHAGKTWLDVPWFWAETFFYRRVLQAVNYFQPGAFDQRDPFANQKQRELDAALEPVRVALNQLPSQDAERFRALMHADLWGNRVDLSLWGSAGVGAVRGVRQDERDNLLVDDTARVLEHLTRPPLPFRERDGVRVDFICDNAGAELLFDLVFADFLLTARFATTITLHLKAQPFYVSDAMIKDVEHTRATLAQSPAPELRALAARLEQARVETRLNLAEHPFWTTYHFFRDFPADVRAMLGHAHLVISKGDANYRRLVGDYHWDPTMPFAEAVEYFPAPVVALRTLKAALIVGLPPGRAEELRAQDAEWLVNGKRGVIQFAPR
ncbi:MAG: protein-glutamate O-methyltransferase family protein [Chloroflexi bacterium]|nr:protein-glutamate O-methyltransferase family protein [Chloroflexota bacterium]